MSATQTAPAPFDHAAFAAFCDGRSEPDWLQSRRQGAFNAYQALLHKPLDPEEFKRIDRRTFRPEQQHPPAPTGEAPAVLETLMQDRGELAGTVVLIHGPGVTPAPSGG